MSKTFDDLKLGDSVWLDGVEMFFAGFNISPRHNMFLTHDDMVIAFCFSINDERLSLTEPLPKLKRGQPIWVRSEDSAWFARIFIAFDGEKCTAALPESGWMIVNAMLAYWDYFRLPTRNELAECRIDPDAWETSD